MKRFSFLAAAAFCLAPAMAQGAANPPPELVKNCESCHGPGGNGATPLTPRINGQQAGYLAYRLQSFLDVTKQSPHATNSMWQVVYNLNAATLDALAKYFAAQPQTEAKPGNLAAKGKTIYEKGIPAHDVVACQQCHGSKGEGHDAVPRLAGQHVEYLKSQLWNFRNRTRENTHMHPNTRLMEGSDIDALASYLGNE